MIKVCFSTLCGANRYASASQFLTGFYQAPPLISLIGLRLASDFIVLFYTE